MNIAPFAYIDDIFACSVVRQQLSRPRTPIKYIMKSHHLASDNNENPIDIRRMCNPSILHFGLRNIKRTLWSKYNILLIVWSFYTILRPT